MFVKCVEGRAGYKQIPGKVISGSPDTLLVRLYTCTDTHRYTHFDIHRYTHFDIHRYTHFDIHRYSDTDIQIQILGAQRFPDSQIFKYSN